MDAIKEVTGVDFWQDMTFEEAKAIAAEKKVPVENTTLKLVTSSTLSKNLLKKPDPTNLCLRTSSSCLHFAKKNPEDERFTDRFELFIMTKEYGNAFTELNDPIDQLSRFEATKPKNLGTMKQRVSTTTTSRLLNTVCHQQVDWESVSTVSACSSQIQLLSVMSCFSQQ